MHTLSDLDKAMISLNCTEILRLTLTTGEELDDLYYESMQKMESISSADLSALGLTPWKHQFYSIDSDHFKPTQQCLLHAAADADHVLLLERLLSGNRPLTINKTLTNEEDGGAFAYISPGIVSNPYAYDALAIALLHNRGDTAQFLVSKGALSAIDQSAYWNFFLIRAAIHGHEHTARVALENGATQIAEAIETAESYNRHPGLPDILRTFLPNPSAQTVFQALQDSSTTPPSPSI